MADDHEPGTLVGTHDGSPTADEGPASATADGDAVKRTSTDRYRVINRIGKGGMGEVMQVRDDVVGRDVALKRIRRADPSDRLVQRFLREASIQGRLEHPSIVPLYDLGRDSGGMPFFTMRKLTGTTLAKILTAAPARARTQGGPSHGGAEFTMQRLLRAFAEVCLAIEYAHVRGIIHRDLKPDNIVLGDFGEVYVLDWGVAKVIGEHEAAELADVVSGVTLDGEPIETMPGTVVGTAGYMAPEQVRAERDVDARADVYALGCILFEILTRSMLHPKGEAGLDSTVLGIDARPTVRAPDLVIAPELEELCVLATQTEREDRIQSARELGDRVQQYLDGDRDLATRRRLAKEHLSRAQAAFATGEDRRAIAMREAASAVALDPELSQAAELVGRLMLEPPRDMPAEVERAIDSDEASIVQGNARVAVWAYVMFLGFMPLAWWIAPAGSPYVLALSAMVGISLVACWFGTRTNPHRKEGVIALTNAFLLAIVARMYTPFLIAPGLAAMSCMALLFTPTRSRLTSVPGVLVLTTVPVLGAWMLERVSVLSITTTVGPDGMHLTPLAVSGTSEPSTLVVTALYVLALLVAAVFMASRMSARIRAARRLLHLQAWQLRQLVPADVRADVASDSMLMTAPRVRTT